MKSVRKSEEPYDFTYVWDIQLKLMDIDNSVVVARRKGVLGCWGCRATFPPYFLILTVTKLRGIAYVEEGNAVFTEFLGTYFL